MLLGSALGVVVGSDVGCEDGELLGSEDVADGCDDGWPLGVLLGSAVGPHVAAGW